MRRSMVSLVILMAISLMGLGMFMFLSASREESASSSVNQVSVVAADPITAGVILTSAASEFGWGDLVFNGDYAELTLAGQRVIVYENLNPTQRPDTTLEQVIANMAEYAAPQVVFLSSGRLTPDEIKVDEKYTNTIFVMNLATREDVETLLSVLPATASDINRMTISDDMVAAPSSEPAGVSSETTATTTDSGANGSSIPIVLIMMLLAVLIVAGFLGQWWKRLTLTADETMKKGKSKRRIEAGIHAKGLAIEDAVRARATDFAAIGEEIPVIHKLTTYVLGDDHYDESFPIELSDKTFLGECGVGIAAPVTRYDQGKVTAFEAWLFDKNDVRTVSAVLLSEHAAGNRALREQMQSKGEGIEAKPGMAIQMETRTLRIRVCVLDTLYGFSDTLPQRSFFDHIVIELAVWQK